MAFDENRETACIGETAVIVDVNDDDDEDNDETSAFDDVDVDNVGGNDDDDDTSGDVRSSTNIDMNNVQARPIALSSDI